LTQRFSLVGTVLTKVIMRTPPPSWMVMALLLGTFKKVTSQFHPLKPAPQQPFTGTNQQQPGAFRRHSCQKSLFAHLLTQRFWLMGTVLTKVIMRTPPPSWMVMALLLGSMALAVTGTLSTAVQSHILFTGLLWMLRQIKQQVWQQGGLARGWCFRF
jgi:hypothetical protein